MSPATKTPQSLCAERPLCPVCDIEMQLVRVVEEETQELWFHKCGGCGYETSIIAQPIA